MKWLLSLLILLGFVGCHSVSTIAYNLPEREANEVIVLLNSHGISAQKIPAPSSTVGGGSTAKLWNIAVPASSTTEAIGLLNQSGLPRAKSTTLLDLFGDQGLVPSELQNRIRYQEGLSEQLAGTIRKMDGILDADVQITFPQEQQEGIPLTASVYVKHRGVLDNPNAIMVNKIKRLVSSALPGLTVDNVSVIADRVLMSDVAFDREEGSPCYDYISIWGLILAKQSALAFRLIFFFLLFLVFVLLAALVWIAWKGHLLIKNWGLKSLFALHPYVPVTNEEEIPHPEEENPA